MEDRRRPKRNNFRRPQNKRPPRGHGEWQPTVPSWEKQFCKVVGSFDWKTLMQMQEFMHLYENVVNWNDSACKEAFCNAKKRFWAEINGLSCDVQLPDPNLYIDEINWDSEIDPEMQSDLESGPGLSNTEENHEPVIIFGDSLISNQGYSTTGWGDYNGDNLEQFPANSSSINPIDPWQQNWGDSLNDATNIGLPGFHANNVWDFNHGSGNGGYITGGGGWNDNWGQNYAINNFGYELGPYTEADKGWNGNWGQNDSYKNLNYEAGPYGEDKRADGGYDPWNNSNDVRNSSYKQMPLVGTIYR